LYFYGKCNNSVGTREYMHMHLSDCYTVHKDGSLSIDNWRT
jgi:hypothetical protein